MSDRSIWALSGDNDDDNSLVTSGSLSSDLGEEWKNWCVDDPDWASDVSAKDGRMNELSLFQRKQVENSSDAWNVMPFSHKSVFTLLFIDGHTVVLPATQVLKDRIDTNNIMSFRRKPYPYFSLHRGTQCSFHVVFGWMAVMCHPGVRAWVHVAGRVIGADLCGTLTLVLILGLAVLGWTGILLGIMTD